MFKSRTNRFVALLASFALVAWVGHYWFFKEVVPIYPYQPELDRAAVVSMFEHDYFWLTTDSNKTSAVEHFEWQLDTRSASYNLFNRGNLKIYVYRVEGQPRGFITYHPMSSTSARILYLAVDQQHRCHGCAVALVQFALDDLRNCGYKRVELLTRLANEPARRLYEKFGFKEYSREDPLIYYERSL